jgi:cullin-4
MKKVPDNFLNDTKAKLLKSLTAVFTKTSIDISKEELYRGVEDLCSNKLGSNLYDDLYNVCNNHISNSVNSLSTYTNNTDNDTFSSLVDKLWLDHCEQLNTVRNIFLYLDRSYALQTTGVRSIWDMGLDIFRKTLESKRDIESKIIVGLLASVEADR